MHDRILVVSKTGFYEMSCLQQMISAAGRMFLSGNDFTCISLLCYLFQTAKAYLYSAMGIDLFGQDILLNVFGAICYTGKVF